MWNSKPLRVTMRKASPSRSLPDWLTYWPLRSPSVILAYLCPSTLASVSLKSLVDFVVFVVVVVLGVAPPAPATAETSLIWLLDRRRAADLERRTLRCPRR